MKKINQNLYLITRHLFLICLAIYLLFYVILKLYIEGMYFNYILLFVLGLYLGNEFAVKINDYFKDKW